MMRHPWARWTLVVIAVAAAAGAGAWALNLEAQQRRVHQAVTTADVHLATFRGAASEVRRALAAMASPGQAAVGWSRRATAGIDEMRAQLTGLAAVTPGNTAPRSAVDAMDRLSVSERRLRDHATGGKPLMAADVAFGEAMPQLEDVERQMGELFSAASISASAQIAALRDQQMAALGGGFVVLLLGILLLAPLRRTIEPAAAAVAPPSVPEPASSLSMRSVVPVVPAPAPIAAVAAPAPLVDLKLLAAACGELATVTTAESLATALDHASTALGARGVIVWLHEASRQQLQVAATAGYDARLVGRLGPVAVTDDNPTAQAYIAGRPYTSAARDGRLAAASVPLSGAAGTRGVVSAEIRATDAATLAAVTAGLQIVAAQLSLVVGAAPDDTVSDDAPVAQSAPV